MPNSNIFEYIKEITTSSRNGKLVFFVGAGVSTLSDYPQWWRLVDKYHEELYGSSKNGTYSSDELLRIPQIFYNVKGPAAFDNILEGFFQVDKSTNQIHDKILAMNPVHIITTNYDNLIETACWKRGKYFSVISAEEDVANANSPRYILKVHGDFRLGYKGENVVLKEDDYLNYDQNYPLISNLMKTIIATHTIVFLGYGLADYNINMLLNWVRKLQRDSYNKPFFIRTDPSPIEKETLIYYEKKGLRIIDAASLKGSSETDYFKRYSTVMNYLIDSKENKFITKEDVIEYIYEKISPLFSLQHIRKIDLKHVFEYDYHFEVNGTVVRHNNKGFGYMEHYFKLREDNNERSKLSKEQCEMFNAIFNFFETNGIICMAKDAGTMNVSIEISNLAYHGKYDEMRKFIEEQSMNIEDDFKKAFFLACLGRWQESYNLYSEVILNSIEESNLCLHYLSQINRYRVYQSITQSETQFRGHGLFTEDFLARIDSEMKNFDIGNLFSGMPSGFQKKYKILEFLSDNQFLYEDTVKLFELTNKVRSEMSKGSYSFGLSSDIIILLRLTDNLRFLYENFIWSTSFREFHQYVRNSMSLLIEKAEYERTRDIDEIGVAFGGTKTDFYIDYYDFVNITRNFKIDDIKNIEKSCSIDKIRFDKQEKIEEYLVRIAEEITKQFSANEMNIAFYNQFINEAKVALYFAKYIKLSEEGLMKIVKTLLFHIPERYLNIGERHVWLERLTIYNDLPKSIISIIDDFLVLQAEKQNDPNFSELSSNGRYSRDYGALINHFEESFISKRLSEIALCLTKEKQKQMNFLFGLLSLLSIEAKSHLLSLKKIEDIDDLMIAYRMGLIDEVSVEHEEIVINYLETKKKHSIAEKKTGIHFSNTDYMGTLGVLYFLGELNNLEIEEYVGIDDKYDFFVKPENFDYKRFIPAWLKNFNGRLLDEIARNKHMKDHVIQILKERVKNTNDKRYLEILMNYFI
ncbi:SIR2 family protein [Bacillus sp. MM09(2025)]|uniref:SIR2 family protein n=1 Tax=Bacillus sp. MM09(2025) TaxID=3422493 RepID=UPI003D2DE1A2